MRGSCSYSCNQPCLLPYQRSTCTYTWGDLTYPFSTFSYSCDCVLATHRLHELCHSRRQRVRVERVGVRVCCILPQQLLPLRRSGVPS